MKETSKLEPGFRLASALVNNIEEVGKKESKLLRSYSNYNKYSQHFILYTSNKMMITHCALPQIISFGPAIAKCKKKKHYVHEVVRNACKDDHVDGVKMSFFLSTNIKYISY